VADGAGAGHSNVGLRAAHVANFAERLKKIHTSQLLYNRYQKNIRRNFCRMSEKIRTSHFLYNVTVIGNVQYCDPDFNNIP
jgi:hypothetical protein